MADSCSEIDRYHQTDHRVCQDGTRLHDQIQSGGSNRLVKTRYEIVFPFFANSKVTISQIISCYQIENAKKSTIFTV